MPSEPLWGRGHTPQAGFPLLGEFVVLHGKIVCHLALTISQNLIHNRLLVTFIKIASVISLQKRRCLQFFMLHQTLEEQDRETHLNLHKDCKLLFQSNSGVPCE